LVKSSDYTASYSKPHHRQANLDSFQTNFPFHTGSQSVLTTSTTHFQIASNAPKIGNYFWIYGCTGDRGCYDPMTIAFDLTLRSNGVSSPSGRREKKS
jgi:hypothetical protein